LPLPVESTAPTASTAGDTIAWRLDAPATPAADGWAVKVTLAGPATVRVDAAPDPDLASAYVVTFGAATTSALPAGSYTWTATASKGTGAALERVTVGAGRIAIAANPETVAGAGGLTHAERALALVEARIEELLADNLETYSVAERSATRRKLAELQVERNRLRTEVYRRRNGGRLGPRLAITFGRRG
jgi:hypothetical protein